MPGQLRMRIRYLTWATPWFDYLLASPAETEALVADAGWRVDRTLCGPEGNYVAVLAKRC
jgi:hypothetical protein